MKDPGAPTVVIVGAGLGGLTLAILLEKAKIEYLIFEKASEVKPLGIFLPFAHYLLIPFWIVPFVNPLLPIDFCICERWLSRKYDCTGPECDAAVHTTGPL